MDFISSSSSQAPEPTPGRTPPEVHLQGNMDKQIKELLRERNNLVNENATLMVDREKYLQILGYTNKSVKNMLKEAEEADRKGKKVVTIGEPSKGRANKRVLLIISPEGEVVNAIDILYSDDDEDEDEDENEDVFEAQIEEAKRLSLVEQIGSSSKMGSASVDDEPQSMLREVPKSEIASRDEKFYQTNYNDGLNLVGFCPISLPFYSSLSVDSICGSSSQAPEPTREQSRSTPPQVHLQGDSKHHEAYCTSREIQMQSNEEVRNKDK